MNRFINGLPTRFFTRLKADLIAGVATALLGIPGGMAYAKLAGVNPVWGLYSAMAATFVASLTTGSQLMISTLTSAIAISTSSVLELASVQPHELSSAVFTLTFLMGIFMLLFGVLRMGKMIDFVSNAVMTGFLVGAATLIIIGELGELVGMHELKAHKVQAIYLWFSHISSWDPTTTAVGFSSIAVMILFQMIPVTKHVAGLMVLLVFTLAVDLGKWGSVMTVGDIAKVTGGLPHLTIPDFHLIPRLALGSVSLALVALTQGAGVSNEFPNPDKSTANPSRDLVGEGLGNIAGSFLQSLGTGGSLTRTQMSVESGAKSRLAGVFAAISLMLIVLYLGNLIRFIPLAAISGVLCIIASKIILDRFPDIKLIAMTSIESTIVMIVTFVLALTIPLQWTIFIGGAISLTFYLYASSTHVYLYQWFRDEQGYFERKKSVGKLKSNEVMILDYEGNSFFAEVPTIRRLMPSPEGVTHAVIIWRMRGCEDVHSTFLKWLKQYVIRFHAGGNKFILEGVEPHVITQLERSGVLDVVGRENLFPAKAGIFMALESALEEAHSWIEYQKEKK